ncbi:hypothetical protein [Alkalihalobacillus sp. R86527]|uniref:alpha/beta hydrolase family protein n=1 Tax=Alkalihalobacillus sp. R86527 TaxID=3093863 RepID=UPI003670644D
MEQQHDYERRSMVHSKKNVVQKSYLRLSNHIRTVFQRMWKGASYGALLMTMFLIFSIGFDFHTGLGKGIDILIFSLLSVLGTLVIFYIVKLFVKYLVKLPVFFIAALAVSVGLIIYTLDQFKSLENILPLAYLVAGIGLVIGGFLGYPIVHGMKRPSSIFMLAFGTLITAIFFYWLFTPGITEERLHVEQQTLSPVSENPSLPGKYDIKTFTYGSGTDKHREVFGEKVDVQTTSVNGSALIGDWSKLREMFWGFTDTNLPINGRVWMPDGEGKFPLVLMVHGNHKMEDFSDEGYRYLGELLASRGFITVSVDENFLNSSWSGSLGGDINGRAWMLLSHLKEIEKLSTKKQAPFYEKVDFENIALTGHSRGGQAAILAAKFNKLERYPNNAYKRFDFQYNIKSVIAIAPTDYHTIADRKIELNDVNYLILHGSYDSDLSEFEGDRQFNGITLTGRKNIMKAALYVDRANHGQFNTTWGDNDTYFPFTLLLNKKPLLDGKEQRQIAKTYVSGFLEATLHDDSSFVPMFEDYRYALEWLPSTTYINKYEDPSYHIFSDFEEDVDVSTASSPYLNMDAEGLLQWYEGELEFRRNKVRDNHGVFLKWDHAYSKNGSYTLSFKKLLENPYSFNKNSALTFTAGNVSDEEEVVMDFSIVATSENGESASVQISDVMSMHPVLPIQHTKTKFYEEARFGDPTEPVLQTFNIPMTTFMDQNSSFQPEKLTSIRFKFDESERGKLFLDHIGVNRR